MNNLEFVVAAYAVTWIVLISYAIRLRRGETTTEEAYARAMQEEPR
ncbi:MAG TPA: hypothetical protein VEI06_00525 [Gemmatimonadaceae bacterium]|nr:hypothetical protein [Gemmatimonadaceae bacterium]